MSPRMNTVASRDQFKPIRIGENEVRPLLGVFQVSFLTTSRLILDKNN